jgi:hypothetical protein
MLRRHFLSLVASAVLGVAVWLIMLWQPARQVRLHTERLLSVMEHKDWKRLDELMADDYSDRWGQDKRMVIERSKMVFSQFFSAQLTPSELVISERDGLGTASAHVTLKGTGGPIAEMAIERMATLRAPFVFTWRQRSGKPWDWVLSHVEHPDLEIGLE